MRMLIDKGGKSFDILQLSQGERSLLALEGDIARCLAMMNPALEDPLRGEGIILIDEVDLHLHLKCQRTIVRRLRETFPYMSRAKSMFGEAMKQKNRKVTYPVE